MSNMKRHIINILFLTICLQLATGVWAVKVSDGASDTQQPHSQQNLNDGSSIHTEHDMSGMHHDLDGEQTVSHDCCDDQVQTKAVEQCCDSESECDACSSDCGGGSVGIITDSEQTSQSITESPQQNQSQLPNAPNSQTIIPPIA
jgi:hypothetical protein